MNYISPINNYLNVSHIKSKNIFLSKRKCPNELTVSDINRSVQLRWSHNYNTGNKSLLD